jgi:hypothetical protein
MISLIYYGIIAACVFVLTAILFQKISRMDKKSEEDYLYKISRVTGHSEYDVFCKSAEAWPVSREKIEEDFTRYLQQQDIPHYVNDFVRRNKKHIDEFSLAG